MPQLDNLKLAPYWWDEAPRPPQGDVPVPQEADVAIIGSGNTGLSAALTAARGGRSVAVLEAESIGHGASSRNGGGVGAAPFKLGFSAMEALLGRERTVAAWQEGLSSVRHMAELVEREQISCHFTLCGRFIGAWRPLHYEAQAREADLLRRHVGYDIDMVPRREQAAHIGSDIYYGGRFNHGDGVVHPGLFHRGLAERVRSAGALLIDGTRVTDIRAEGAGFIVETTRGRMRAGQVVMGTNGYTDEAMPWLERRFIPVSSQIIATEPLPRQQVARLFPKGNLIVDSKNTVHYYRASPDGTRVLMGGRPILHDASWAESAVHLRRFMVNVFPELADARISHAWGGRLGFTFDKLPHIGCHEGIHYAGGYLGSGVAMSVWLGHKMGLRVLGDPDGATALDDRSFPTIPFYKGKPWFLTAVAAWYQLRDRLG